MEKLKSGGCTTNKWSPDRDKLSSALPCCAMQIESTNRSPTRALGRPMGVLELLCGVILLMTPVRAFSASEVKAMNPVTHGRVEIRGHTVHYLAAGPDAGQSVLLLHGGKYDSGTWNSLGTLETLSRAGFRALAIDLPGFGKSEGWKINEKFFLVELINALKIGRPVIVAPSMSGRLAFPLVLKNPEKAAGFVPIAAVGSPLYSKRLKDNPLPALVLWGSTDPMFKPKVHSDLAACFKRSELLMLSGAGHAAYLDQPGLFHEALLKFLAGLGPRTPD